MRIRTRVVLSVFTTLALAANGCTTGGESTQLDPSRLVAGDPAYGSSDNNSVVTITIQPVKDSVVPIGRTLQLKAIAYDSRGKQNSDASFTWSSSSASASISSKGVVTGITSGYVTISAKSGKVTGQIAITVGTPKAPADTTTASKPADPPAPAPAPTPPPPTTTKDTASWTFCTNAGAMCNFTGLRDVRLGPVGGPWATETAFHSIPCATYGFNGQNPAPGKAYLCDYGPIKTATISNPMPGMGGLGASVIVPLGAPGATGPLNRSTSDVPVYTDGSGAFRTTCSLAKFAFDDPIVYPGQPGASHLHVFFGNTAVNASSTVASIAATGGSTCRGGTLNRTGYWAPALIDSRTGEVQTPDEAVFYYKTGYNVDPTTVRAFPAGLRMIAGNKNATAVQDYVSWGCRDRWIPNSGSVPTACPVGDAIRLTIIFPQCWDGVNLDSPDHKSHMAYPIYRNSPQRSTCPSTHPITLPEITEHFDYPVTAAATPAFWRLSSDMYSSSMPGGFSGHADWMYGWDNATMSTIVTQCLNKGVDCGVGSIGNRTELYY